MAACAAPLCEADREALDELLCDAVASGASVGYVDVPTPEQARGLWCDVEARVAAGEVALLAARAEDRLVGAVQVVFETRPNARHRALISRLLVHTAARRHGLGRALMVAAEREARRHGRTLLLLDVRVGEPAERLYRSLGWLGAGTVPDYAVAPDGRLAPTLFMYRDLRSG